MQNKKHSVAHPEDSQELDQQPTPIHRRFNDKEGHQAAENARHDAIEQALLGKEQGKEKRSHQAHRHNVSHAIAKDREDSFEQTMDQVRKGMPRATRPFSRFIHGPFIEATSDFLSKTLFRPSAILAGGLTAFLGVLGIYFYAKYAGFTLQGSETIIAFAIGWTIGILFDLCKTIATGKHQS